MWVHAQNETDRGDPLLGGAAGRVGGARRGGPEEPRGPRRGGRWISCGATSSTACSSRRTRAGTASASPAGGPTARTRSCSTRSCRRCAPAASARRRSAGPARREPGARVRRPAPAARAGRLRPQRGRQADDDQADVGRQRTVERRRVLGLERDPQPHALLRAEAEGRAEVGEPQARARRRSGWKSERFRPPSPFERTSSETPSANTIRYGEGTE